MRVLAFQRRDSGEALEHNTARRARSAQLLALGKRVICLMAEVCEVRRSACGEGLGRGYTLCGSRPQRAPGARLLAMEHVTNAPAHGQLGIVRGAPTAKPERELTREEPAEAGA